MSSYIIITIQSWPLCCHVWFPCQTVQIASVHPPHWTFTSCSASLRKISERALNWDTNLSLTSITEPNSNLQVCRHFPCFSLACLQLAQRFSSGSVCNGKVLLRQKSHSKLSITVSGLGHSKSKTMKDKAVSTCSVLQLGLSLQRQTPLSRQRVWVKTQDLSDCL